MHDPVDEAAAAAGAEILVRARALAKRYRDVQALYPTDLDIPSGRIIGIVGPNGAGKTTLLDAILGLISYEGSVSVLGREPLRERAQLMRDVCFIADVATLPRWMRVKDLLDYVAGVHPRFSPKRARELLTRTEIPLDKKIGQLSKGMITQLHLAVVMAIDARLLVLDEPTLGLDILFRKNFYTALLEEYFDHHRTILVATHQIEEVEHILTDVIFLRQGRVLLYESLEALEARFVELVTDAERAERAMSLGPIATHRALGRVSLIFDSPDRTHLKELGELRRVPLADLFVALMKGGES
ncbi:MAG: ABC transporter ATP-binding protein [Alphaproteobacteria bacterium]|nr:MAG: ABC transporter ATP-binding protein [Alphaproteobacteria bacterium]